MTQRFYITWAGARGLSSPSNYANCEYTYWGLQQETASTLEEREEAVNKAHSIMSEDYGTIPIVQNSVFSAINSDAVEVKSLGATGATLQNSKWQIESVPKTDNDRIVIQGSPSFMQTIQYPTVSTITYVVWNRLVNSPLVSYNENYELENRLAKDYYTENDGKRIVAELKDSQFHNGDPVTAEDVKFTFKLLWDNPGWAVKAAEPNYESIEVVDDRTVAFNFTEPFLPLISVSWPTWGILNKQQWEDENAADDPTNFDADIMIGSGPFEHVELNEGESLLLRAADTHVDFDPVGERLYINSRTSENTRRQFLEENFHAIYQVTPQTIEAVEQQLGDRAETMTSEAFTTHLFYPYHPHGPAKFREFRHALGAALNRQRFSEIGWAGRTKPELSSCPYPQPHPWRPPEDMLSQFTDDPTGDVEAARQVLEDAGWGWDDDGNLRYPADADLEPLWPAESVPTSDDGFPCLDSEGNWDSEYQA